jgi:Carboxypeptidase regulatory-like domain
MNRRFPAILPRMTSRRRLFFSYDFPETDGIMSLGTVRKLLIPLTASLLALAGPVALCAQDTSAPGASYSTHGTVVNSITGQGVPHALVTLNEDFAVMTDGDGQFSIDNVPQGVYFASVTKPGYLGIGPQHNSMAGAFPRRAVRSQVTAPQPIQVGPDMANLTLRMTPAASIVGQIALSTADQADGIHISLFRRSMHFGHVEWEMAGTARSRSDGTFRIGGLPPGHYLLSTQASLDSPDPNEASGQPIWGYPPAYYPGVTDPGAAGVIALAAGQQSEADITLTRQQFFPVTAVIHTADMQMPGEFELFDMGGHPTGLSAHYDNRRGLAHANLPNGSWVMQGRNFGREMTWGRVEVHVASAPVTVAITMQGVPHIPVDIQREFSSSATPNISGSGLNLVLASAEPFGMGTTGGGLGVVPGSNGTAFQVNLAEPGRFWVEAFPSGPTYVSSITSGGVDLASTPLVIDPGSPPPPIDVTLRDDVGSITGQLNISTTNAPGTTPAASQNAQLVVYAIPQFPFPGQLPQTSVRADGTFTFNNLAPGSWRMVACDTPQEIDYHSPEGLAAWTGKGQTATVDAGGTAHVTLDVTHMESAP